MRWVYHARGSFDAGHALTVYLGRPEEVHVHCWEVEVEVGASALNHEQYGLDFHRVRGILERIIEPLNGMVLNEIPGIGRPSPTAENLALYLAEKLKGPYRELGGRLLGISIWEGPENRVDLILGSGSAQE